MLLRVMVASPAIAAWSPPPDPREHIEPTAWFDARVAELDADAFAVRDEAGRTLTQDPRCTLGLIERRLRDPRPLSPEQNKRLERLGVGIFDESPRGAMGVKFSGWNDSAGVEVGETVKGFDSCRVLESGDVIRELGGVTITRRDEARAAILSHDPGDEVVVRVERRGEPMAVTLRLGSFRELENTAPLEPGVTRLAWQFRWERATQDVPTKETLTPVPAAERWAQLTMEEIDRARRAPPEPERPAMVRLVAGGEGRAIPEGADADFMLKAPASNPHLAEWKAQIANQDARLRRAEMMLRNDNLRPNDRARFEREAAQARQLKSHLRLQIRQVQSVPTPK